MLPDELTEERGKLVSSSPRLIAAAVVAVVLGLLLIGVVLTQEPAAAANCTVPKKHTSPNYVDGWCRPAVGQQVRLRADCKYYPDRYSGWKGFKRTPYNNYRYFYAGNCPLGIRGGTWETR